MSNTALHAPPRRRVAPLTVGLVALALAGLYVSFQLSKVDWDVTHFAAFGEDAVEIRDYAESRLGAVRLRPQLGHDGRFFFVQANDPWVLRPDVNAVVLDRPLYRSQRMFYPLLASGFSSMGPEAIVWGLLIVNLVAMGLGSLAVAAVASEMGISPWFGLAFLLNLGFISELNIDGAGIVAAAAAFGAVALFLRGRFSWGVVLLAVSALSREVMLVVAAGSAWWFWRYRGERSRAVVALTVPSVVVGVWALHLRMQMGWQGGAAEVEELGLPFVGFAQALSGWLKDPLDLIVGLTILTILAMVTRQTLSERSLLGWAVVGFALVGMLLTEQVWRRYFDVGRAMAPIITAFVLLAMARRNPARVDVVEHVGESSRRTP